MLFCSFGKCFLLFSIFQFFFPFSFHFYFLFGFNFQCKSKMHEQNIRYMAIHNIKHTCVLCIFMCNEENNFDIAIYRHFMDFYYYGMMFRTYICNMYRKRKYYKWKGRKMFSYYYTYGIRFYYKTYIIL